MHTRNVQGLLVGRGGEEQRESRASLCSDVLATPAPKSSVNTDGDAGAPRGLHFIRHRLQTAFGAHGEYRWVQRWWTRAAVHAH